MVSLNLRASSFFAKYPSQEPAGFSDALQNLKEEDVEPVAVPFEGRKKPKQPKGTGAGEKKKVKKGKGKAKKSKGSPSSGSKAPKQSEDLPKVVNKGACIATFSETYQPIIKSLPVPLWPSSTKHGEHSYTV